MIAPRRASRLAPLVIGLLHVELIAHAVSPGLGRSIRSTHRFEVIAAVPSSAIDPTLGAGAYHLSPGRAADRGYALLAAELDHAGLALVVDLVDGMGNAMARGGVLARSERLSLLLLRDAWEATAHPGELISTQFKPVEQELARALFARIRTERVELRKERPAASKPERSNVIDMFEALKRSLRRTATG